jgi:hypothetical protein
MIQANPTVVDAFVEFVIKNAKSVLQSKTRQPCTHCGKLESSTWRPGPTGPSSLCNKCGVCYMDSGTRNRTIDLIFKKDTPVWVKKDPSTWKWVECHAADTTDPRVDAWMLREAVRYTLIKTMNPPPNKKQRL